MSKAILFFAFFLGTNVLFAHSINQENQYQNTAEKLISSDGNLTIGGYGEVHYNQPLSGETRNNGMVDVHRIVMFFGYNFSDRTQFVTEVEFEYAKELWIEQAFVQHRLNRYVNFQAGLMLIPMGIINLYHEPVLFNGVERPIIDNKIAPSTWREIGIGFNGTYLPLAMKYQVMMVNGPQSFDGTNGLMNGARGIREGRLKGSKATVSAPNFAGRVEYFGLSNLNIGLSGYVGPSTTKLYDKMPKNNVLLQARADSSVVGLAMVGFDARYQTGGFQARTQWYYSALSNTDAYNEFTQKNGKFNDLGSSMYGYYVEAGYNVLHGVERTRMELIPFVRYQEYDTHYTVASNISKNDAYKEQILTAGLNLKLNQGVILKTDIDFSTTSLRKATTFNAGVGVMF